MKPIQPSHQWGNVAAYEQVKSAEKLQHFLQKEGFESRVYDERGLQRIWFWSEPQAWAHVQVSGDRYNEVREFLASNARAQEVLREAIRCPSCASPNVQYPQMTRKFILPTLVAQVLILLGFMEKECYCEDCHYTWVPSTPSALRTDAPRPVAH